MSFFLTIRSVVENGSKIKEMEGDEEKIRFIQRFSEFEEFHYLKRCYQTVRVFGDSGIEERTIEYIKTTKIYLNKDRKYIIVFAGKNNAEVVFRKLKKLFGIETKELKFNFDKLVELLKDEGIEFQPEEAYIINYVNGKLMQGDLHAFTGDKKSFETILNESQIKFIKIYFVEKSSVQITEDSVITIFNQNCDLIGIIELLLRDSLLT